MQSIVCAYIKLPLFVTCVISMQVSVETITPDTKAGIEEDEVMAHNLYFMGKQ